MIRPVFTTKIRGWTHRPRPTSEHVVDRFKALDLQEGSGPLRVWKVCRKPQICPLPLRKSNTGPRKSNILKPKMEVFFFQRLFPFHFGVIFRFQSFVFRGDSLFGEGYGNPLAPLPMSRETKILVVLFWSSNFRNCLGLVFWVFSPGGWGKKGYTPEVTSLFGRWTFQLGPSNFSGVKLAVKLQGGRDLWNQSWGWWWWRCQKFLGDELFVYFIC